MIIGVASGDWLGPDKTTDGKARWGGSGWARLGQYVPYFPHKTVVGYLLWKYDHLVILDAEGNEHHPDVIIMQRLMHRGLANHIELARQYGQVIINDLDDWYWGLDPSNNAFKHSHPKFNEKENINFYKSILSRSSLLTVSTPYLMDRVKKWVRTDIVNIKNTVDVAKFHVKVHEDLERPTLGWAGSTAHRSKDLETIASILRGMTSSYQLLHVGDYIGSATFASRIGVSDEYVIKKPLVDSETYPKSLIMDVGIVPLRVTPFNQAKSYIKGLEYSAAGVPFVAQKIDAYDDLYSQGIGRIAKRPYEWVKQLKALTDYKLREEESAKNHELVWNNDIKHGAAQWIDILENL